MLRNIGIWGDSLLQGVVLDEKIGRYRLLEENCVASLGSKIGAALSNHSKFGCTAPKGMAFLRRAMDAREEVSAAILEFGGNDCDFNWEEVAAHPRLEHIPRTPLPVFTACYAGMIRLLRDRGITPILISLPPLDAERYFAWITRGGLDGDRILSWLGDVQRIYRWHERYSNAICTLARTYAPLFIDIRDVFLSERDCGRLLCADGIHPNREGHAVMERAFLDFAARHLN